MSGERTLFESRVEWLIVSKTEDILWSIERLAQEHDATDADALAAIHRFSGPDLADCWANR